MTPPAAQLSLPAGVESRRRSGAAGSEAATTRRPRAACPGGSRPTLGLRLTSAWEGLLTAGAADCPVCGGPLARSGIAATCGDCGSTLG